MISMGDIGVYKRYIFKFFFFLIIINGEVPFEWPDVSKLCSFLLFLFHDASTTSNTG